MTRFNALSFAIEREKLSLGGFYCGHEAEAIKSFCLMGGAREKLCPRVFSRSFRVRGRNLKATMKNEGASWGPCPSVRLQRLQVWGLGVVMMPFRRCKKIVNTTRLAS